MGVSRLLHERDVVFRHCVDYRCHYAVVHVGVFSRIQIQKLQENIQKHQLG